MPTETPWSKQTRDRTFLAILATVFLLVGGLVAPYAYVLLSAAVVVVVTWPAYRRLREATRRPSLAAALATLGLALAVFAPLATVLALFAQQAAAFAQRASAFVAEGGLVGWSSTVGRALADALPGGVAALVPRGVALADVLATWMQSQAVALLQAVATSMPAIVSSTLGLGLHFFVFVFAIVTLFVRGEDVLQVIRDLVPLDEAYLDRLFAEFRDLSTHLVFGSLATAALQGTVATIGYAIAGVEGLAFVGLLSAICALLPWVGAAVVYLPVVVWTFTHRGVFWGVGLLAWQLLVTSQVDNLVRPWLIRGNRQVHPLLVFLGILGGVAWIGAPGALVGPLLVTSLVALYGIYRRDFLGRAE